MDSSDASVAPLCDFQQSILFLWGEIRYKGSEAVMVVTHNEVTEQGERYLLDVNTKARAPSVRPGQLQTHSANGSVQSLCVLQKEERKGCSSF